MQNVEHKCELRDAALARLALTRLGATRVGVTRQHDTYFRVPDGRLKKRESHGEPTEYVFYHRPDRVKPKLSHFTIYTESEALSRFGTRPLPVWVTVDKAREIWVYKNAQMHLDEVDGLGSFFEVQALVSPAMHVGRCHELIREVLAALGPSVSESIATSYADMIALEDSTDAA